MKNILIHGLLVPCVLISAAANAGIKKYPVDGKHSTALMMIGESESVLEVELLKVSLTADEAILKGLDYTGETSAKVLKVYKGPFKADEQVTFFADNYVRERWKNGAKAIIYLKQDRHDLGVDLDGTRGFEQFKTTFDPLVGKLDKLDEPVFQAIRDARKRIAKYCANPPKDVSSRSCKHYLNYW